MAYSFRKSNTSRYLVAIHGNGGVFHIYCDSMVDVRDRLTYNCGWAERSAKAKPGDEVIYHLSNGFKPGNLPAGMVKTETRRYGRCKVLTYYGTDSNTGDRVKILVDVINLKV